MSALTRPASAYFPFMIIANFEPQHELSVTVTIVERRRSRTKTCGAGGVGADGREIWPRRLRPVGLVLDPGRRR